MYGAAGSLARMCGLLKNVRPVALYTAVLVLLAVSSSASAQAPQPRVIHSAGNPILSDGSYYSADPAPLVVGDTLYILAGRDEAPPDVNNFIMNEWQLFSTRNVASKQWLHYPGILRPETLFAWVRHRRGPVSTKSCRGQTSASTCTHLCR